GLPSSAPERPFSFAITSSQSLSRAFASSRTAGDWNSDASISVNSRNRRRIKPTPRSKSERLSITICGLERAKQPQQLVCHERKTNVQAEKDWLATINNFVFGSRLVSYEEKPARFRVLGVRPIRVATVAGPEIPLQRWHSFQVCHTAMRSFEPNSGKH